MFAGRIGGFYRSAVLLSTLYNILGICQNENPLGAGTPEGSYPQTEGL